MEQIINIHVEKLPEGVYLATSEDVLHYCQVVLEPTSPFTFNIYNQKSLLFGAMSVNGSYTRYCGTSV